MQEELKKIKEFIENSSDLSEDEKTMLIKSVKSLDSELTITAFKLERTEKVKRTTSILLEETIEELEQKRKAVEDQAKIIHEENERKTLELEEARQLILLLSQHRFHPENGFFHQ